MGQVITRPGAVAAPQTIELGATDELTPTAIYAHFNGASAAGSFLPCVTYYTQDGLVFARSFPADAVAAGASADVSWFPGLGQSPATAASGVTTVASPDATITVTSPTGPTVDIELPSYAATDARYARSTNQTIATGTPTDISFDGVASDPNGWFQKDVVAGTTYVQTVVPGLYVFDISVTFYGVKTATKWMVVTAYNASTPTPDGTYASVISPLYYAGFAHPAPWIQLTTWCAAGDVITTQVMHDYGSSQDFTAVMVVAKVI